MAKLSKTQMRAYAATVGFPNPALMAEVGWAESGGDTKVVNSIGAVGVWQILQPLHVKSHPSWTVTWLQNPLNNARAAKVLFDADKKAGGTGLRPWEDSRLKGNGGGWGKTATAQQVGLWDDIEEWSKDFMEGDGGDFLGGLSGAGAVDGTVEVAKGVFDIAQLGVKAAEWMSNPKNWLNVGYVAGGGLILVIAVSATVRQQVIGQAKSVIGKVKA